MHGDKKQNERDAALRKFVNDECPLMFATDVAARGLDIKGVRTESTPPVEPLPCWRADGHMRVLTATRPC